MTDVENGDSSLMEVSDDLPFTQLTEKGKNRKTDILHMAALEIFGKGIDEKYKKDIDVHQESQIRTEGPSASGTRFSPVEVHVPPPSVGGATNERCFVKDDVDLYTGDYERHDLLPAKATLPLDTGNKSSAFEADNL